MLPLPFERLAAPEQLRRAREFYQAMRLRRTVRAFSSEPVPIEVIDYAVHAAATAPSGANQQPWRFVVVANPSTKRRIREGAEAEEKESYGHRAQPGWLPAPAPLPADWHKDFLELAPYVIAVFRIDYGIGPDGVKHKYYYVAESVGIAVGMLLTALHLSGLATLTHATSPMGFLASLLDRPKNERPYMLIPVGYPAEGVAVPDLGKKSLAEVRTLIA